MHGHQNNHRCAPPDSDLDRLDWPERAEFEGDSSKLLRMIKAAAATFRSATIYLGITESIRAELPRGHTRLLNVRTLRLFSEDRTRDITVVVMGEPGTERWAKLNDSAVHGTHYPACSTAEELAGVMAHRLTLTGEALAAFDHVGAKLGLG